jgi:hypothetical protein
MNCIGSLYKRGVDLRTLRISYVVSEDCISRIVYTYYIEHSSMFACFGTRSVGLNMPASSH